MKTKDFIKVWDGFTPFMLNVYIDSITDSELIKSKRQYDNYFDNWDVTYITTNGNGILTLEIRG